MKGIFDPVNCDTSMKYTVASCTELLTWSVDINITSVLVGTTGRAMLKSHCIYAYKTEEFGGNDFKIISFKTVYLIEFKLFTVVNDKFLIWKKKCI